MPSWRKINIHLQRYWAREVLGKFPVMQHLRFGKLFAMTWEPTVKQDRRQLEYVSAPKRTEESVAVERRTQSHMAAGYQEEFTAIKSVHCFLCSNKRNSSSIVSQTVTNSLTHGCLFYEFRLTWFKY